MKIVGHARALASLPDPLPQTILITGPEGTGKRHVAHALAARTGVRKVDFQNLGPLTAASAREMIAHHWAYPVGEVKVSVADLTNSSPAAANAILKLLEEPPPYSHLILHTDRSPLLTIRSRCTLVPCGLLSEAEVLEVLTGLGAEHAQEAARASQGRVSVALEHSSHYAAQRSLDAILGSLERRDGKGLEDALVHALDDSSPERLDALRKMARRAILTRQGPVAAVAFANWKSAMSIMDSPGRAALAIRSAFWTLALGL